jgi:kynurenine formamidase
MRQTGGTMSIIDLGQELYDGQQSHFRVSVREFLSHADTAPRLAPPAQGYATRVLQFCDHTSTHVDAPLHFYPEGKSIDQVPVDAFVGTAICLDFSTDPVGSGNLGVERFERGLEQSGLELKAGDVLLMKILSDGRDVYNGLDDALSRELVSREIKALGVDRGTPDFAGNKKRPAHVHLLGAGILIMEGLANLEKVAGRRFMYYGLPLKIRGGTGSPIRPIAVLE